MGLTQQGQGTWGWELCCTLLGSALAGPRPLLPLAALRGGGWSSLRPGMWTCHTYLSTLRRALIPTPLGHSVSPALPGLTGLGAQSSPPDTGASLLRFCTGHPGLRRAPRRRLCHAPAPGLPASSLMSS